METKERKPHLKRGLWKPEEDIILKNYVETHGEGNWADVSERSGLMRGGKSCRLRWKNYLRPNLKRGGMSEEEEDLIIRMHKLLGNRWSLIAGRLPGRTDNEVKNYWNTHLNKKCHLGKRRATESTNRSKDRDEDNNNKKKKQRLPLSSSQPICTAITQEDTPGLKEKNEVKKESSVSSTWMEDIRSFNYDPESPLLLPDNATFVFDDKPIESPLVLPYSAAFLFDDEPSFTCFDSFLLF